MRAGPSHLAMPGDCRRNECASTPSRDPGGMAVANEGTRRFLLATPRDVQQRGARPEDSSICNYKEPTTWQGKRKRVPVKAVTTIALATNRAGDRASKIEAASKAKIEAAKVSKVKDSEPVKANRKASARAKAASHARKAVILRTPVPRIGRRAINASASPASKIRRDVRNVRTTTRCRGPRRIPTVACLSTPILLRSPKSTARINNFSHGRNASGPCADFPAAYGLLVSSQAEHSQHDGTWIAVAAENRSIQGRRERRARSRTAVGDVPRSHSKHQLETPTEG